MTASVGDTAGNDLRPALEPRRLFEALEVRLGLVVVAVANAALRATAIAPRLGATPTHLLGPATLLVGQGVVAFAYFSRVEPHSPRERVAVGVRWAGLTVAFEFTDGHSVAGQSWAVLAAQYDRSAGRVWIAAPLFLVVAPSPFGRGGRRRSTDRPTPAAVDGPPMDAHLRAGIAVFNAGGYHAAHDAWEDHWLGLESGTDDERFLHGLIQFTAAVHHAAEGNADGARGLAESAVDYLEGLGAAHRGVDLEPLRTHLQALAEDPLGHEEPPALTHRGAVLLPADLDFEAATVVARVLAEAFDAYDETVLEDAIRYARPAVDGGTDDRFVALVIDFVAEPEYRDVVYDRLAAHVERRRAREAGVDGLFEE